MPEMSLPVFEEAHALNRAKRDEDTGGASQNEAIRLCAQEAPGNSCRFAHCHLDAGEHCDEFAAMWVPRVLQGGNEEVFGV